MADPINTFSDIPALAFFTSQFSGARYQTTTSFQSNQRIVRELRGKLEALNKALEALQGMAINIDDDLTILRLPLLQCSDACKDFEAIIAKCTTHSGKSKTSFRDWAKLRYMGDNMSKFKNLLAGYRSNIMVALNAANM
ncbi:hypothetical protein OIDMADRAFT_136026 [Oidiodendron maius Zn]|uniref:Azaphilone pigments biosynthesis cluster protein L N-terminal domain-containing protein n=1 Tax=Oidiodendron maius (strain Zn) TaxID=913774 RepID=A0A0C3GSV4_OIDMZ|nr:hypothetical protein OIDMADRAFT_136026 [Oidiodendron maius Zn]